MLAKKARRATTAVAALAVLLLGGCSFSIEFGEPGPPVSSNLQDFVFESFTADFFLDLDQQRRSTLRTVETIVPVFPDYDQNRGIRRLLPERYQGAPTGIEFVSITDEQGRHRPVELEREDDVLSITSRARDYLHGRQVYVLEYLQRDVTRFFADQGVTEFYWDVNGTDWAQPFGEVVARIHLGPELAAARLPDRLYCYRGVHGSTERCAITAEPGASTGSVVITATAAELGPGENITVAIGFQAEAITPRDASPLSSPLGWLWLASLLGLGVLLVHAIRLRTGVLRDAPGRPIIIAEYLPPVGAGLLTSADLVRHSGRAVVAQLLDLAVQGAIRVIEVAPKRFLQSARYAIETTGATPAEPQAAAVLRDFFPSGGFGAGERYEFRRSDATLGPRLAKTVAAAQKSVVELGYRSRLPGRRRLLLTLAALVLGAVAFITPILLLDAALGSLWILVAVPPSIAVAIIVLAIVHRRPLTPLGAEHRDHLRGLRRYITVAEADRLRYLQSPEGALRAPAAAALGFDRLAAVGGAEPDRGQLLRLHERLLPYAALFGLEDRWAKELAVRYEGEAQPGWYVGTSGFQAGSFAHGVSAFAGVSSSFVSSSSSGGSGGGGSSGGGGGGGGGGGV